MINPFDAYFAEIEIEPPATRSRPGAAAKADAIRPSASDPARKAFNTMRGLAFSRPFPQNGAEIFFRQARFMKNFVDNYDDYKSFFVFPPRDRPTYQRMDHEQLRSYFTWRTKLRQGQFPAAPISFLLLHIYELLANIGVKSHVDGLDQLTTLWTVYREKAPQLDQFLPGWIRDYHVYYPLPLSFAEFIEKRGLRGFYKDMFLFSVGAEDCLDLWNSFSPYDITESRFYADGHGAELKACFYHVLGSLRAYCADRGFRVEELFVYSVNTSTQWIPFTQALFHPWRRQPDRRIDMPGGRYYICKDACWSTNATMYAAGWKDLAGYLIKKTEVCLRLATGYRYKLNASVGMLNRSLRKIESYKFSVAELNEIIEKAVADYHRESTRTVVSVDRENLARIREEALDTQSRLIVPEAMPETVPEADLPAPAATQPTPAVPSATDAAADGWSALADALSQIERQALALLLEGQADLDAFAGEHGYMPEVLADGLNEKAFDHIGDSLLDTADGMAIYEEYRTQVAEMVGLR